MSKRFRIPNSLSENLLDLYAAREALEESGHYLNIRIHHRYDSDGDFIFGFLTAIGNPQPESRWFEPAMLPGFGDFTITTQEEKDRHEWQ